MDLSWIFLALVSGMISGVGATLVKISSDNILFYSKTKTKNEKRYWKMFKVFDIVFKVWFDLDDNPDLIQIIKNKKKFTFHLFSDDDHID